MRRVGFAHVPIGHELVPVRVGVHGQHDHVTQETTRLIVRTADQLIDGLDQLLCAEYLVSVQPAIDPDDRFALGRQRARLRVGQSLRQGKASRDVTVVIESPQVLGR